MRQIHYSYTEDTTFRKDMEQLKEEIRNQDCYGPYFQIYAEASEKERISKLQNVLQDVFPEASYSGCSANGCIYDSTITQDLCNVVATVFEKETTQTKVFQYNCQSISFDEIGEDILKKIQDNPWVKAVELLLTLPDVSIMGFCEKLSEAAPQIHMLGGIACNNEITRENSYVFSSEGGCFDHGIVATFYGGDDFHVTSMSITGWRPLGKKFHITRAEGSRLFELDGKPAYDAFNRYLSIKNDEYFFHNTLEFPLSYEHHGMNILRAPLESLPDGSILLSADIEENSYARIAYGDPKTILENIRKESSAIRQFHPDVLHIFSCAARRSFWKSEKDSLSELNLFKEIAPSNGFFTLGEFLRSRGFMNQYNVTLVIGAMREGEFTDDGMDSEEMEWNQFIDEMDNFRIPIVIRLANYISEAARELEDANQKLEKMNQKLEILNRQLEVMAIYDGLTKLYNRVEIQRRITNCLLSDSHTIFSLVMFDLDDFKCVNDTFGHKNGDYVIITMANILRNVTQLSDQLGFAGRWGGEEFMLLLPGCDSKKAYEIAEKIRKEYEEVEYVNMPGQTTSVGVTQAIPGEDVDALCTRVDAALYKAKKKGKNRVVLV